eukprot:2212754-Amphidinium_carterae.2
MPQSKIWVAFPMKDCTNKAGSREIYTRLKLLPADFESSHKAKAATPWKYTLAMPASAHHRKVQKQGGALRSHTIATVCPNS